jgi:hypothetical protein
MKTLQVTLDTNVLDNAKVDRIKQAAHNQPVEFANVTVSDREVEGTSIKSLSQPIIETGVWGESRWGQAVWGGETESDLFETLISIVSNRSFPRIGNRDNLTKGQRRQIRDVMILVAHTREGRDILVTDEKKAFRGDGSLKDKLEALCSTRIMNTEEFCNYCNALKNAGNNTEQKK